MKIVPLTCIIVAITITATCQTFIGKTLSAAPPNTATEAEISAELPSNLAPKAVAGAVSQREPLRPREVKVAVETSEKEQAKLEEDYFAFGDVSLDPTPSEQDLSYLTYYVYAELPPDKKPAEIVLESQKNIPIWTPLEEIRRASSAFRLDFSFMKTVAKIESGFDPRQRTGSYIGLFQLSNYEFGKYGSGDITSPRDNAIAAAYKFVTEAILFEWETHKKPTFSDLYLIHQQGWQGAAEHVAHPGRIAWKSMCVTDEGREKGEKWCKRAIWGNTLPTIKHIWKSVDNLTSDAFVTMWRRRVDLLYSRYSGIIIGDMKH